MEEGFIKAITGNGVGTLIFIFIIAFFLKFLINLIPSGSKRKKK